MHLSENYKEKFDVSLLFYQFKTVTLSMQNSSITSKLISLDLEVQF